jgi:hypothetical protein
VIYPEAPESYHENPKADPHWKWQKEPEVQEAVRPQVAELARVATFLASEGTGAFVRPCPKLKNVVANSLKERLVNNRHRLQ